ncbi:hypothetical protein DFH08DRAFT_825655 [Mycena albidolilacea]|uniref:Uncharacterized protein n=1 Tax=Mycena albidolilacea TaxID=1033008 RepID=A0AAD6Z1N1_9AGAR|nr:hypothetical protein DFH08DRAFT_825655 [Mycena albidolilacea]
MALRVKSIDYEPNVGWAAVTQEEVHTTAGDNRLTLPACDEFWFNDRALVPGVETADVAIVAMSDAATGGCDQHSRNAGFQILDSDNLFSLDFNPLNFKFLKQKELNRSHRWPGQDIAIHSEAPNGAAKDNIATARTSLISNKHIHINPLNPLSKCEPIPPKICTVPSSLRPDPLVSCIVQRRHLATADMSLESITETFETGDDACR